MRCLFAAGYDSDMGRFLAATCLVSAFIVGCSAPSDMLSEQVGKTVGVEIRRDAKGITVSTPAATDTTKGMINDHRGKLLAFDSEWVLLEDSGSRLYIPRSMILTVVADNP